jgi:lantibiotic modifying enzyme
MASRKEDEFDIISGRAGAIPALLALRGIFKDEALAEFAVRLGDELLQTAQESDAGYSWQAPGQRYRNNLTGFSHGTAGVAFALAELV